MAKNGNTKQQNNAYNASSLNVDFPFFTGDKISRGGAGAAGRFVAFFKAALHFGSLCFFLEEEETDVFTPAGEVVTSRPFVARYML